MGKGKNGAVFAEGCAEPREEGMKRGNGDGERRSREFSILNVQFSIFNEEWTKWTLWTGWTM
jgi:hypothetical protein